MLGKALADRLTCLGDVNALGRTDLNLQNIPDILPTLMRYKPDIIVNAAAYTDVEKAEHFPYMAYCLNRDVARELAHYAQISGALLVHYSTDYVFDGNACYPYLESDITNPLNIYGLSKRAGEMVITSSTCRHIIIRTSCLYATHGIHFIQKILHKAQYNKPLHIVADQYGTPTPVSYVADISIHILRAYYAGLLHNGIIHATASGKTTWHHLATYIITLARAYGLPVHIQDAYILPILAQQFSSIKRPKNSQLSTQYLTSHLKIATPPWQEGIHDLLQFWRNNA